MSSPLRARRLAALLALVALAALPALSVPERRVEVTETVSYRLKSLFEVTVAAPREAELGDEFDVEVSVRTLTPLYDADINVYLLSYSNLSTPGSWSIVEILKFADDADLPTGWTASARRRVRVSEYIEWGYLVVRVWFFGYVEYLGEREFVNVHEYFPLTVLYPRGMRECEALRWNYTLLKLQYTLLKFDYGALEERYRYLNASYAELRKSYLALFDNYTSLKREYEMVREMASSLDRENSVLKVALIPLAVAAAGGAVALAGYARARRLRGT